MYPKRSKTASLRGESFDGTPVLSPEAIVLPGSQKGFCGVENHSHTNSADLEHGLSTDGSRYGASGVLASGENGSSVAINDLPGSAQRLPQEMPCAASWASSEHSSTPHTRFQSDSAAGLTEPAPGGTVSQKPTRVPSGDISSCTAGSPCRQTMAVDATANEVMVQEMRYSHLFNEHKKLHVVVREKAAEIERMAVEKVRLQAELDRCRWQLAVQHQERDAISRSTQADVLKLLALVDVLLSRDVRPQQNQTTPPPKPVTPRGAAERLQSALAEVEELLVNWANEQRGGRGGAVPKGTKWLADTLSLGSRNLLGEPVDLPRRTAPDVGLSKSHRLDAIEEARIGTLQAADSLSHYLALLDYGFPSTSLSPAMTTPALSLSIKLTPSY